MQVKKHITYSIFIVALLVAPIWAFAQSKIITLPKNANDQIEYTETVNVVKTSQSVLFKRSLHWLVGSKTYKFKKVELMDNSFGRLIAAGKFVIYPNEVLLHLSIDVKDNKAVLTVTRFDYNMQVGNIALDNLANSNTKQAKILIPKVSESMKVLIKDFREYITSGSSKI